jgi:hypothetical protein
MISKLPAITHHDIRHFDIQNYVGYKDVDIRHFDIQNYVGYEDVDIRLGYQIQS